MESSCHYDSNNSWMNCTLCRSGRQSYDLLHRAQERRVEWTRPNTGLYCCLHTKPLVKTSLDEAFGDLQRFLKTSSRQCGCYHHSHASNTPQDYESLRHTHKYHSPCLLSSRILNYEVRPPVVDVEASAGCYFLTAERWTKLKETPPTAKHVVRVDPGQTVSITLSV